MLEKETLLQSSALATLTESQIEAIVEMSKNDENAVIGSKIGELHGKYDADILESSGIAKNNGEKSYDYAKRVIGEFRGKLKDFESNQAELKTANDRIKELQDKLDKGGDPTMVQQIKDYKTQVTKLQEQLQSNVLELATTQAQMTEQIKNVHVDYAFKSATQGLKFKPGITDNIKSVVLNAAKSEVLAKGTPDLIEENGTTKLVFRDAEGNVLMNKANNLNPYTLEELLMETNISDILESGRVVKGGGTKPVNPNPNGNPDFVVTASTQVEASAEIDNYLLSIGLTRTSPEFFTQRNKLWTDNNVASLKFK